MATMNEGPGTGPAEDADMTGAPQGEVAAKSAPKAKVANPVPDKPAGTSPLTALLGKVLGSKKPPPPAPDAAASVPAVAGAKPGAIAKPGAVAAATPAAPGAKPGAPAAPGAKPGAPGAPGKAITGPLVTIVTRNQFYRDGFRNLVKIAILEGIVIIALIFTLLAYIANNQPQDRYFATTADGRIMQMTPLDKANLDTPALLSWVAASASDVMTFNYTDYQKRLQQSSRHFTKAGWESFAAAMQRSRILDSVSSQSQMVSAQPASAPVLIQEGPVNGKYRWLVTMPLVISYKGLGSNSGRSDTLNLSLVVERVAALENPNGVGFAQWIAQAKQ